MKKIYLPLLVTSYLTAGVVSIGPEAYYVERTRASGTYQSGVLYGGQIAWNRLKKWGLYMGMDTYVASGIIKGYNFKKKALKSTLLDWQLEGRIGFNFPYITLFSGYGYLGENINFIEPSPTTFHYRDSIKYIPIGFLSLFNINTQYSVGLNAKAKWMTEGRSRISNDPRNAPLNLLMGNEWQYRVDLPFNYNFLKTLEVSFSPFYEFRHYGNYENYPYVFVDTKYQIWGSQLNISYFF
ncbi:MAG: hypothetical protein NTY13_04960 [Chlamydiae bacterium]|nr:hypothetical protein [Chlamydiota bacterium]